MKFTTLTNWFNPKTGDVRHGSEISITEKKYGGWVRLPNLNCNQNPFFAKLSSDGKTWNITRYLYGKEKIVRTCTKI